MSELMRRQACDLGFWGVGGVDRKDSAHREIGVKPLVSGDVRR